MKIILFVPQTKTNYRLLKSYSAELDPSLFKILFLRNRLSGDLHDIGPEAQNDGIEIVSAPFLLEPIKETHEWKKALVFRSMHTKLVDFIKGLHLDLIIVGVDARAIGRWCTIAANQLSIPSLVCQEGCRGLYEPALTLPIRIKRWIHEKLSPYLFWPVGYALDYNTAKYAAVWGEYDRKIAIRNGAKNENVIIIGRPLKKISDTLIEKKNIANTKPTLLFLDVPILTWPAGSADYQGFQIFRKEIIKRTIECGWKILYKLHPLIVKKEKEDVSKMVSEHNECCIIENGLAEDYFAQCNACATFPSTAVYSALENIIPLLFLMPQVRGFKKILWDPTEKYGAGIRIKNAKDINSALKIVLNEQWIDKYAIKSRNAILEIVGTMNNEKRFQSLLLKILNLFWSA